MRGHSIRLLVTRLRRRGRAIAFTCCAFVLGGSPAFGEGPARPPRAASTPVLRIEAPQALVVGATATIGVLLRPQAGPEQPLLLTPSAEGEAVRVVRGRLLRADAQRTPAGELRFEVPIVARRVGTAVLRVELLTYRCSPGCVAVHASASRVLEVGGS